MNFGYDGKIFGDMKIDADVTLNYTDIKNLSSRLSDSFDSLYELTLSGNLSEKLDIVAGGSFENNTYKGTAVKDGTIETIASYAQMGYRLSDWLKLIAGGQLNKVEDIDLDFSCRFQFFTFTIVEAEFP